MSALKILVIPGSLRTGSLNARLAAVAAHEIAQAGAEVTRISLSDFPLPIYDGDLQSRSGVPKQAVNLKRMIGAHHGVLVVTPEYNSSVPALVKNTIDWVSRVRQDGGRPLVPWRGKIAALCSSSDGNFAGVRCLNHLRAVLVACQVEVISPQCSVPRAQDAFDDNGEFKEERLRKAMTHVCRTLIERADWLSMRGRRP